MERINELYNQIKDLEDVLSEYNTSKNKIKRLENEIKSLEDRERENYDIKIRDLENELNKVENEIKKIDLCSKDCHSLSDIRMMLQFVSEKDILFQKVISYLESLIYPIFVSSEQVENIFKPSSFKENYQSRKGDFKVLKINLEIDDFFDIIKSQNELFCMCQDVVRKILKIELEEVIPSRLCCYVDEKYLFLLILSPPPDENSEEHFLRDLTFVSPDYLHNLENVIDILNEIFKKNLCKLLLTCSITCEDLEDTNLFFSQTEFFITNVDEWKLDCAMKEIITLSKRERKWLTTEWQETNFNSSESNSSLGFDKEALKNQNLLPKEISCEVFQILLCIKVVLSCKSKRIEKAEKIIERAISKMMSQDVRGSLLHYFIVFSDLTVLLRLFPSSPFSSSFGSLREEMFFRISKMSTEINKSLNESLLLLKVYFKEKHYDFMLFVEKFVSPKSKMAFEINFFNLLYANICDHILCIKYIDNEKVGDIFRLIQYVLGLSSQVPSGCIEQFKRLESFSYIFKSPLEEIIENSNSLKVSHKDLSTLLSLLFKPSKEIRALLDDFDGYN